MESVRAGLVGLGRMGRNHARVLGGLEAVNFIGAADPGLSESDSESLGIKIFESTSALIAEGIDMCVVAVPTEHHFAVASELASSGIAVLVEKPLAGSSSEARLLVDLFENTSLVGCVGHIERFNPAIREMRSRVENGQLGQIYEVSTNRTGPYPGRIRDVGVTFDLATHDLDITQWITQSEYAMVANVSSVHSNAKHEDMLSAIGYLTNGIMVSHKVNWLSPFKTRQVLVTGERGALLADTLTADLTFFENGDFDAGWEALTQFRGVAQGNATRYAFEKKEPLRAELEAFRDAVMGSSFDIVTMRQGLRTVEVAEMLLESSANQMAVSFQAAS